MFTLMKTSYRGTECNEVILTAGNLVDFNNKIISWAGDNSVTILYNSTFTASYMEDDEDCIARQVINEPRSLNFLLGAVSTLPDKLDLIKENEKQRKFIGLYIEQYKHDYSR